MGQTCERALLYWEQLERAASAEGVDPELLGALLVVEGSGERAVSPAGALGLMQLMPDKLRPGDDPFDVETNLRRAAQHLATLAARHASAELVAAAYFGALDERGQVTNASDGIVTGHEYVRRFRSAAACLRSSLARLSTGERLDPGLFSVHERGPDGTASPATRPGGWRRETIDWPSRGGPEARAPATGPPLMPPSAASVAPPTPAVLHRPVAHSAWRAAAAACSSEPSDRRAYNAARLAVAGPVDCPACRLPELLWSDLGAWLFRNLPLAPRRARPACLPRALPLPS